MSRPVVLALPLVAVAVSLLASRPQWARGLLQSVDAGVVKTERIGIAALRKILLHDDKTNARLVAKHWGQIEGATTDQMRRQVAAQ